MKQFIKPLGACLFLTVVFLGLTAYRNTGSAYSNPLLQKDNRSTPNVIIIFMDDMGYGDLECYGGFSYHTPNINKLAAEGMRFTNFYVAQAVCSASRSALMTGCYPTRIGISGALGPYSAMALNPAEETIAEILKTKNYHTGIIGKWHLGSKEPYLPLQQGFDEYLGLPYSNDMWPVNYDGSPNNDTATNKGKYPPLPLIEGNKPIQYIRTLNDQATLTTIYTERAVSFISKNKNKPFFLYLAHSMPHVPIAASSKFRGKSGEGLYGDVMEEIDWSVGEVMKTLETNGLTKNTLVIFTSDNGPWLSFGNHAGNTGGLREGKGTAWDGGLKVPCIISWPGKIPKASICNQLASTIDLLPTIATVCRTKMPDKKIDGVNIWPLLSGQPGANPRDEFVYYYDKNNLKGVRKGRWKLVLPNISQTYQKPDAIGADGFPGKYASDNVSMGLYDLRTDPGESRDLKDKYPAIVAQLMVIADRYRKEIGDGITNTIGAELRPAAIVKY
ncbi:MAG: hypothetical protein RLZZ28_2244 [Bacteroidota bacterium]